MARKTKWLLIGRQGQVKLYSELARYRLGLTYFSSLLKRNISTPFHLGLNFEFISFIFVVLSGLTLIHVDWYRIPGTLLKLSGDTLSYSDRDCVQKKYFVLLCDVTVIVL